MKFFKVKVNGNIYDVEVEEVSGTGVQGQYAAPAQVSQGPVPGPSSANIQPQAAPVKANAQPPAAPAKAVSAGGKRVECPMAGKILEIKVKQGDTVKENQTVIILESMKMENEVVTPYSGVVSNIAVSIGQSVNAGDLMIAIS